MAQCETFLLDGGFATGVTRFPGPGLLTAGDGEGLLEAGFRLDVLLYT
jgi:hypothetical protein